jgi:tetratricopeptide (TPR) repeat protein
MNFDRGVAMTTRSPRRRRFRTAALGALAATLLCAQAATAQAPAAAASAPAGRSALDAALFYQLLLGELELRGGDVGDAYEVMLDAARRTRDDAIFLRAIEIALHARAGEQALSAARAWRSANPRSIDALRYEAQILIALNRTPEAVDPLRALIEAAPVVERPGLIGALPRMFQRAVDRRQAATLMERALEPWLAQPATRTASRISIGRAWLAAGDTARALELARQAQADDGAAPGAALLALEMLPGTTAAEPLVLDYLKQPGSEPAVRLAYVRMLTASQRYTDAVKQLQELTAARPDMAAPWLSLGALWLELREPAKADEALQRFVQLAQAAPTPDPGEQDDEPVHADDRALVQAWLMLAQAAEQRGDYAAAERWLAHIDSPVVAAAAWV